MSNRSVREATKHPWLKFFPSDWRSDPGLRVCSLGARGLWIEMLCLMHEAEPRGSLLIGEQQVTAKILASLTSSPLKLTNTLLHELERNRVFSRDEDGTIYSRRIRRDVEKHKVDVKNGKRGGNPNLRSLDNGGVNPPLKGGDKTQKPDTRSQKPDSLSERDGAIASFIERFKAAFRARTHLGGIDHEIARSYDEGVDMEEVIAGAERYARERDGQDPAFTASPVRWLREKRWMDHQRSGDLAKEPKEDRVQVERGDPIFELLEGRLRTERPDRRVPSYYESWGFPRAWVDEARASP